MDIKHCGRLSWFSRKGESHEQDGEKLCARIARAATASGDPAMAFMSSSVSHGRFTSGVSEDGLIAVRPDGGQMRPLTIARTFHAGIWLSGECRAFQ
jgi:hypothetical protein